MALRIRFQYPTASRLGYSIERLSDSMLYDFSNSTFVASPATPISPLPEDAGIFIGRYRSTLSPTPSSQFSDGDYVVTVHDQASSSAVVAELAATFHSGDDATAFPTPAIDPWSIALPGTYAAGTAGAILGTNLDARVSSRSTFAGGAVASVTAPVTVGTNNDKTGYALSPAGLDRVAIEPGIDARQALSAILAQAAGLISGASTGTLVIKGAQTGATRIVESVDGAGNRSSVTLNLPAPAATGYTFSGPASGIANAASTGFTVTPNGTYTGTITITPSNGGQSTPIVLTFSNSSASQDFSIAPPAAGTVTLTPTNGGGLANPSSLSYAALMPTARSYSLTGPSSGTMNVASGNFTVTPVGGAYTGTITITPSGGGLSTPIVKTFSNSSAPQTFTITPPSAGMVTLTPTNGGSLTNPPSQVYAATIATYLHDTFTDSAGTSIVGHVPDSPSGATAWSNLLGEGTLDFVAGGGVTGVGSAANWSSYNPVTGGSADLNATITFTNSNPSSAPTIYLRLDGSFSNLVAVVFNYRAQKVEVGQLVSGSYTSLASFPATITTGTLNTLAVHLAGTTITGTLNGESLIPATTIPAGSSTGLMLRQQAGSAGDVTYGSITVTS